MNPVVRIVGATMLATLALPASAAVYKCTEASGRVRYQQQPCPQQAQGERLNVGEWRLLDETQSGAFGSAKTFFDPEHIAGVDGLRRVAFKRFYTPGSSGKVYPDEQYYHFFECATGLMSLRVNERDARPGVPDRSSWAHWSERTGPYPNIRQVFDAACPGAAAGQCASDASGGASPGKQPCP